MLLILFFRGVSLPGSREGLAYYLWPEFDKIISADVSTRLVNTLSAWFTKGLCVLKRVQT